MDSGDDQTFSQNIGPKEVQNITITEDADTTYIKAGVLKITIPNDIKIIFNAKLTASEISVAGTAQSFNRVDINPLVAFEDKDKTMVIPILEDFEPGDTMVLRGVYFEGFHESPSTSTFVYMTLESGETVNDLAYIFIQSGSTVDSHTTRIPSDIVISDVETGVKVTWTDPTDLDLQYVNILRGKNGAPVTAEIYEDIKAGVEEYVDTDVVEGDVVEYILYSTDGRNRSENSERMLFTVGSSVEEEAAAEVVVEQDPVSGADEDSAVEAVEEAAEDEDAETADTTEKDPDIEEAEDATDKTIEEETSVIEAPKPKESFSDIENHWAKDFILGLATESIVSGDPKGTFRPDEGLNRAEAAAMLHRVIKLEESMADSSVEMQKPFSDVALDSWYINYVFDLKELGLVKGNPDGTYMPEKSINRAEFLQIAMNTYKFLADKELKDKIVLLEEGGKTGAYIDIENDAWYASVVTVATELNFVSGSESPEGKQFKPGADITRAEATKILFQMFVH